VDEEELDDYMEMLGSDYLDREFMKYISEQFINNLSTNGVVYEDGDFTVPEQFKTELHEYYKTIKDWRQNHDLMALVNDLTVYGMIWDMYYSLDTDVREQVSEVLEEYLINK
jgi:hypothetical protein